MCQPTKEKEQFPLRPSMTYISLARTYLDTSHLKRFEHTTITRLGGSKKHLFPSGVGGWNNHLQIKFLTLFTL